MLAMEVQTPLGNQTARVIVDDHREQVRSYRGESSTTTKDQVGYQAASGGRF